MQQLQPKFVCAVLHLKLLKELETKLHKAIIGQHSRINVRLNQFQQPIVTFHIKTSHLNCSANQITGFYMKYNTGLKLVNVVDILVNNKKIRTTSMAFGVFIVKFTHVITLISYSHI